MTFNLFQIPKQNAFNFLRLCCCVIVICMHIFTRSGVFSEYAKFFDGHSCVCVFFILSGFWITRSYLSTDLKNYFIKRAKRILPLYYLSIGGGVLIFAFASELSFKEFFLNIETWKYLFWNSIFLNFMHPSLPGCFSDNLVAVNGALWTIKIEITFYVLLPFLMKLLKKLKSLFQVNITLLVLYILSIFYTFILQKYHNTWNLPKQLVNQFPAFVSCFVSGMFLVFNWEWILKKLNLLIIPSVLIFVLHYVTKTEFLMPIVLSLISIFFAIRFSVLNFIEIKTDFSYPLYLFHFPLIQLMTHFNFYKNCFPLAFFLTFAGSFLISIIAMKIIDFFNCVSVDRGESSIHTTKEIKVESRI